MKKSTKIIIGASIASVVIIGVIIIALILISVLGVGAFFIASRNNSDDSEYSSEIIFEDNEATSSEYIYEESVPGYPVETSSKYDFQIHNEVSFGPNAAESEKTREKIQEHKKRLEILDEQGAPHEGLNYVGYSAKFDDEGKLIVDGYMRNFTGYGVYDITGNIILSTGSGEVAGAYFEFSEESFGTLENGKSRPWRIVFDKDLVYDEYADLSSFSIMTQFDYSEY